ncbi:protein of unknown function [Candidatus Methylocalor cossyra]|uniref:Transposase n=1 Tax=Candidatus Methylocalor cossyra TaxID=3108543 RepID=A0ABM9NJ39_9GAMM
MTHTVSEVGRLALDHRYVCQYINMQG